jgi:hypothetical protein
MSVSAPTGSLSVRVSAGSYPPDNWNGELPNVPGVVVGSIGTNDPARWRHLLWFDGEYWAAELLSDVIAHVPTYEELRSHFDRYRGKKSPWKRVVMSSTKLL